MYKLIIVDDEKAIRRGMIKYIPWHEMGFEVVADFEDGKETLEYLVHNEVDVIITDIEMAEVSGLDLIGQIVNKRKQIKMVILSGHKNFDYARKALEYKVEHYLLKPLHTEEVKEVFGNIKAELDQEYEDKLESHMEKKRFISLLEQLKTQFFIGILVGRIRSIEEVEKKSSELGIDFRLHGRYAIMNLKSEQGSDHNMIDNLFEDSDDNTNFYILELSESVTKIMVVMDQLYDMPQFESIVNDIISEKTELASQFFGYDITIHIDAVFSSLEELLTYNFGLKVQSDAYQTGTHISEPDHQELMERYKVLVKTINSGAFADLEKFVKHMFFDFRNVPLNYLQQLIIDLFSMFSSKLMKMENELWKNILNIVDYHAIMNSKNKGSLQQLCLDYLKEIVEMVKQSQSDISKKVVMEALSYIENNYADDISLENIADRYHLNPAYFSRLFKQYSGMTFTDYLISIRMKKAITYIKTGKYKMYEISKLVGYNSEKYFFRVFKQYTGYSPAEYYRSKVLLDEEKDT